MHSTDTELNYFLAVLGEVCELPRYLLTLVVQAATAGVSRWLLGVMLWSVLGWIVDVPFSPSVVGYVCALAPLVWSASAFWHPGGGWLWHQRVGAFDPSVQENRRIDAAFDALGPDATAPLRSLSIYVVDEVDRFAFVRGQSLILSRGLVDSDALPAVLAHEIGHARSIDGRLMQALDRLALWGDPLMRARDVDTLKEYGVLAALASGGLRWLLRLAGGSLTLRCLLPLWSPHWRRRERAADECAVALGQGPALAKFLENWEQPAERPEPRLLFNLQEYERIAYRLDVLRGVTAPS